VHVRADKPVASSPNVILIVTDDQRFDTLWAMPHVRSELVAHGVKFTDAFVVNPTCCPSRSSILTGLYSHSTGVYSNKGEHGGFAAFDPSSTVATWLHDAGYETGLMGKYLNGYTGTAIPPGWDVFNAFNQDPETSFYYNYTMNVSGTTQAFGSAESDYSTTVLGNMAAEFIESSARSLLPLPRAARAARARQAGAARPLRLHWSRSLAPTELQRGRRERQAAVAS
jgi:N-acetylglucosamine-6-sulfatase